MEPPSERQVQKKMDYEPLLTILFALGIAAALIAYAALPRGRSASVSMAPTASVGSFAPVSSVTAVQTTEMAVAAEPVTVDASPLPAVTTSVDAAPVADVAPTPVASVVAPVTEAATPSPAEAKPRRSTKRKSTTAGKSRARSSRKAKN